MHNVEEIELTSGVLVRCRPVSPLAVGPVYKAIPEPDFPMENVRSAAGGSEEHPALPESEAHDKYYRELRDYRNRIGEAIMDFKLNYGIVSWSYDGGESWTDMPPDDWEIPFALKHWGVEMPEDRYEKRVLYIKNELILSDEDDEEISNIIGSRPGKGPSTITPEEIQAQLDPIS